MYDLTRTDREMLSYVQRFNCIAVEQLPYLLPQRTEEILQASILSLIRKGLVSFAGAHKEYLVDADLAAEEKYIDKDMVDAIWIMLEHLGEEAGEAKNALIPRPPAKLCYMKGDYMYYVLALSGKGDSATIRLLDEDLSSRGINDVKVFVVLHHPEDLNAIPEHLTIHTMLTTLSFPEENHSKKPKIAAVEKK